MLKHGYFLIGRADGTIQSNGLEGDHQID